MPHMLILESYLPTGQACEAILQREGWEVTLSQNAQEALKALHQTIYDAVLVDLDIPTGDGWHLIQTLHLADSPAAIIAMLDLENAQQERARDLGVFIVLPKPISKETLLTSALNVLDNAKVAPLPQPKYIASQNENW